MPGIVRVGLDTHVGFIWNDDTNIFFVHASGGSVQAVIKEKASESHSIRKSKLKMLGKLTGDYLSIVKGILMRWLKF